MCNSSHVPMGVWWREVIGPRDLGASPCGRAAAAAPSASRCVDREELSGDSNSDLRYAAAAALPALPAFPTAPGCLLRSLAAASPAFCPLHGLDMGRSSLLKKAA